MNMFKNKKFEVKMVEDRPDGGPLHILPNIEPKITDLRIEQIADTANDFVTKTAVTFGLVYGGVKVLNTICDIAKIAAKAKF